uniref:Uncharacterized protein n=1 Tax=Octopus bimaculoides TaxID=37653 RepID=A0A0L8FWB7_OCTBM
MNIFLQYDRKLMHFKMKIIFKNLCCSIDLDHSFLHLNLHHHHHSNFQYHQYYNHHQYYSYHHKLNHCFC